LNASRGRNSSRRFCLCGIGAGDFLLKKVKEYMFKTDEGMIPRFSYLYHDGVCYSKPYVKRDLYANTIAKIKRELTRQKVLDYKARIEKLDWFWQKIISGENKKEILDAISSMTYDDMISCYSIIKQKQCVLYLKNDILELINQKVISNVRSTLDLPYDENVYFDLKHIRGRTYEAGIKLDIKTKHIIFNGFYKHCKHHSCSFEKLQGYPKIVFRKNIHTTEELVISQNKVKELQHIFEDTIQYKEQLLEYENCLSDFEGLDYKIRIKNNFYTVLSKTSADDFEILIKDYFIKDLDICILSKIIQQKQTEKNKVNPFVKTKFFKF